jgi:hypothetical protein
MLESVGATKVVHLSSLPHGWQTDPKFVDHIYIGRSSFGMLPPYTWGNPYVVGGKYDELKGRPATREDVVLLYDWHILRELDNIPFAMSLLALHGKTLVCWCKSYTRRDKTVTPDYPCHGDPIAKRAAELYRMAAKFKATLQSLQDNTEAGRERARQQLEHEVQLHARVQQIVTHPPPMTTPAQVRAALNPLFKQDAEIYPDRYDYGRRRVFASIK